LKSNYFCVLATAILLVTAAVKASGATADQRLVPCLACHGENGQSLIPEVPSLGSQPVFFLSVQLLMFREKMRTSSL